MDKYDLAARLTIAGMDTYEGTIPAKQQRALFGKVLFGKRQVQIRCEGQGTITQRFACWEGTHTSYRVESMSFEDVCTQVTA